MDDMAERKLENAGHQRRGMPSPDSSVLFKDASDAAMSVTPWWTGMKQCDWCGL
jgi:hypothetical protein